MIYLQDRSRTVCGNIDTELAIEEDIALAAMTTVRKNRTAEGSSSAFWWLSVYFWYFP